MRPVLTDRTPQPSGIIRCRVLRLRGHLADRRSFVAVQLAPIEATEVPNAWLGAGSGRSMHWIIVHRRRAR